MNNLMSDIFRHPYLKERFLLKGGTCLNFCYLEKPRLSVDIDLNYIGALEKETMLKERKEIDKAIKIIINDQGHNLLRESKEEHAGGKWRMGYKDINGYNKNLELDINYMFRYPIGESIEKRFKVFNETEEVKIKLVSKEELFAGKVMAALSRSMARDLYDLYNIVSLSDYDKQFFRKIVIFLGVALKKDFRNLNLNKVLEIDDNDFENSLKPLLREDDDITKDAIIEKVTPFIGKLLEFSSKEREFVNEFLDKGSFKPELLFDQHPGMVDSLKRHPVVLWKQKNLIEYLKRN
ncbi:MAG: nucleotidyl transferase AbiEii/AbiGii toxin family protein [Elusimicrobia bacterium]|nr:nucleotidyl transferase AbiEii/AbiGii toxin family protein [Elusimicrobiota bacterium]